MSFNRGPPEESMRHESVPKSCPPFRVSKIHTHGAFVSLVDLESICWPNSTCGFFSWGLRGRHGYRRSSSLSASPLAGRARDSHLQGAAIPTYLLLESQGNWQASREAHSALLSRKSKGKRPFCQVALVRLAGVGHSRCRFPYLALACMLFIFGK